MIEMPDRRVLANHGKNLQRMIVALDGPLSDGGQRNAVPDMLGDNRVYQDLPVIGQTAKP